MWSFEWISSAPFPCWLRPLLQWAFVISAVWRTLLVVIVCMHVVDACIRAAFFKCVRANSRAGAGTGHFQCLIGIRGIVNVAQNYRQKDFVKRGKTSHVFPWLLLLTCMEINAYKSCHWTSTFINELFLIDWLQYWVSVGIDESKLDRIEFSMKLLQYSELFGHLLNK